MNNCRLLSNIETDCLLNSVTRCCLMDNAQRCRYRPGELILPTTNDIETVGYMISGQAEAFSTEPDDRNHPQSAAGANSETSAYEAPIYTIDAGDFFGDLGCLTGHPGLVTVICSRPAEVVLQPSDHFLEALESHTELKCLFLQSAFQKLWQLFQLKHHDHRFALLHETTMTPQPSEPTVQKALRFIATRLESPLTIGRVAQEAGLSPSAFSRRFKAVVGVSFKTYLTQLRISHAKYLISRKGLNVTEACFAAGFNDVAHFSRTFRKYEGINPSSVKPAILHHKVNCAAPVRTSKNKL